jgi:hypothetical protein
MSLGSRSSVRRRVRIVIRDGEEVVKGPILGVSPVSSVLVVRNIKGRRGFGPALDQAAK